MFISLSISDTIMHRVRESTFLLFTAIIIALTIPATCATGSVPLVMAGIVVTGFCVGPLFPLALARGGRVAPKHLAEVAAALSIIGYAAHLGGPPLIGFAEGCLKLKLLDDAPSLARPGAVGFLSRL